MTLLVCICLLFACNSVAAGNNTAFWEGVVVQTTLASSSPTSSVIEQIVEVKLLSWDARGQHVMVHNFYQDGAPDLFLLSKGDRVIIGGRIADGLVSDPFLQDRSRKEGLSLLIGLFFLLIICIGGLKGIRTLVTLGITFAVLGLYLLPTLLAGGNSIVATVISAVIIVSITLFAVGGFSAKSLAALIGTLWGVAISGGVALWIGELSALTGIETEETRILWVNTQLDVRGLLYAGIILGSLGAVADVGMSIASATSEIQEASRRIGFTQLVLASLNVGRDIMGTMANTLILAYVGAALPLLLVTMQTADSWFRLVNSNLVMTEILRGMAGSIGLIAAIPITAVVSALFMRK